MSFETFSLIVICLEHTEGMSKHELSSLLLGDGASTYNGNIPADTFRGERAEH